MKKTLNIAIAGLGVVGSGVYEILTKEIALINKRSRKNIKLVAVASRTRKDFVDEGHGKTSEKLMWIAWKKAMLDRKKMNRAPSIKGFLIKSLFKSSWGERRVFPELSAKSFNELWREQHDKK